MADDQKVVQRSSIRDDGRHRSEAETLQRTTLFFEIVHRIVLEDAASLEEGVELEARFDAKHAAQLCLRHPPGTELLGRQSFQGATFQVCAISGKPLGEIIGNAKGNVHRTLHFT